jgi:hypothetical protein
MREKRNTNRLLVGKSEGKRPLLKPKRKWWITLRWILYGQDGVVWTALV